VAATSSDLYEALRVLDERNRPSPYFRPYDESRDTPLPGPLRPDELAERVMENRATRAKRRVHA